MNKMMESVKAILSTTPVRWLKLAQALPLEILSQPPAPEQWSALECLQHMIDTEQMFQYRLSAFLKGQESFPAFNPDAASSQVGRQSSALDLVIEFTRLREESLNDIGKVKTGDLKRAARHQELGMVTLEELLNLWPAHDLNHLVQAERALMQPFIQGSGPWKQYYSDYLVKPIERK